MKFVEKKPDFMEDDQWEDTKQLIELTSAWIELHYGERCPDFEPHCYLCHVWSLFDAMYGRYLESVA